MTPSAIDTLVGCCRLDWSVIQGEDDIFRTIYKSGSLQGRKRISNGKHSGGCEPEAAVQIGARE